MFVNKKGLSTIVVTLIIILISLVAVGIVWVVVRNIISGGVGGLEVNSKCLTISVEATKVNCTTVTNQKVCDVELKRTGTGTDEIAGVKLVFKNETNGVSSSLISADGNIEPLVGKTVTGINTNITGVNKLETTVFFKDKSGKEQFCQQTLLFENSAGF